MKQHVNSNTVMETRDHSKNGASLKSQMSKKNNSKKTVFAFYWFLPVILMMLGGCAKNIPITKSIINEVGGIDNAKNFQYYVSKTITLRLVAQDRSTTIQDGQLIRKSKTSREKIVITEKLPGLLRGDYNEELIVAFEEYDGNPRLWFGVTKWSEGKHELLYQFPKESIVKYGNERYKVSYEGKGQPYLLIKMKGSSKESSKSRKAKGLKLGKSK